MTDTEKSSVLKNQEEFAKHGSAAVSEDADAAAREDMKHMAEKTKAPGSGSSGSGKA